MLRVERKKKGTNLRRVSQTNAETCICLRKTRSLCSAFNEEEEEKDRGTEQSSGEASEEGRV